MFYFEDDFCVFECVIVDFVVWLVLIHFIVKSISCP